MPRSAYPCERCPLHKEAISVCMGATGPLDPLFAVIAEAPGAEEDVEGLPLIGPSGSLLWSELDKHGLSRCEAFVTNVVKCRPPGNRTPKASEIKACSWFLASELDWLEDVGCKYILALGGTAYKQLGGTGSITEHHGSAYQWKSFTVFPCIHPAAALRSPQQMKLFVEGIAKFAQLVQGKAQSNLDLEVIVVKDNKGLTAMVDDLISKPFVAYDIESIGLDEQHPRAGIMSIAYCGEQGKAYVVLLDHPERTGDKEQMEAVLSAFHGRRGWIAHNGKFDSRYLEGRGIRPPALTRDTIIMAHLLDENLPKNVEAVAARTFGLSNWGVTMKDRFASIQKAVDKGLDIPYPPVDELAQYTATDVAVEFRLNEALWNQMGDGLRRMHNFLIRVSHCLQDVERIGVWIDRDELQRMEQYCEEQMQNAIKRFATATGKSVDEIKLGSSQWLTEVLFGELELPVVEFTENGSGSTNEHSLKKLRPYAPEVVGAILDYRKYQKFLGSYLRPWKLKINDQGRLRSVYNITGTVTGRLACSNVKMWPRDSGVGMSLHQVPRDGMIRSVVAAPPGRKLLVADYSQIELRVAAALADEKRMAKAYRTGEDLHTLTAATVTGKPISEVTKEERTKAKAVNFGFLYGMGSKNFVNYAFDEYGLVFTLEEAEKVRNAFFNLYSGLRAWHASVEDFVRWHGYVMSPLGRIRRLPDVYSPDKSLQYEAIRQAINSPVQATASDFTLAAMVILHNQLKHNTKLDAQVVGQVHDSILVECNEKTADEVASLIKEVMEQRTPEWIAKQFGYHFPLPLGAEVAIGQAWGKPEKVLD